MKRFIYLLALLFCCTANAQDQNRTFSGFVMDGAKPLAGASVYQKDMPANGVATDKNGSFSISLKGSGNVLVIKFIGFTQKEINVSKLKSNLLNVDLVRADDQNLDDVVVVAYGKKKKITNTGSVSQVSGEEIRDVPTSSVQNTLSGRVPGFFSMQTNGQPGTGSAATFYIRGIASLAGGTSAQPLIIVDDIEYSYEQLAQINANEIEAVSILKDASSTAVYGVRGANGVLIISTRRGKIGKPRFNFSGETGLQWMAQRPKFLNSYQTALLRNEALRNDGLPEEFTAEDLEHFKNGTDPFGHPDVNWMDVITKKITPQSKYNMDISGGSQLVKYMISLGYLDQWGILKNFSKDEPVDNNFRYNRFNFRSNIDLQATQTLKLSFDLSGRIGVTNSPNVSNAREIMGEIYKYGSAAPYANPVFNPDGSYPYNPKQGNAPSVLARLAHYGYKRNTTNDQNILLKGVQDLNLITPGLTFTTMLSYSSAQSDNRDVTRGAVPTFYYNPTTGIYTPNPSNSPVLYRLPRYGVGGANPSVTRVTNINANFSYDRTFGGKNHFSAQAILNQRSNNDGVNKLENVRGISFVAGYDYKRKYMVDFAGAYNGSNQFIESKRYGFFPAVSAGWNLAEERFFKKAIPFFDLFKLRGSYGVTGNDKIGTLPLAEQVYNTANNQYSFGETNVGHNVVREGALANPNVTWEKESKLNLALDLSLFNGKLTLGGEYFNNLRYDQLITRGTVLQIIGIDLPRFNMGKVQNQGWEAQFGHKGKFGQVDYFINGNISYARNKIVFIDEAIGDQPWLALTGRSIGTPTGYIFEGFWESTEEIARLGPQNLPGLKPGDLKYKDMNGDGKLDNLDRSYIGNPTLPSYNTGLSLGVSYKGLRFDMLFQSSFNYSYQIWAHGIDAFNTNLQPIHLERWTPENKANAKYPRLTSNAAGYNSSYSNNSTFWLLDGSYIRLKSLTASWSLPDHLTKRIKMNNARVYATAYNLYSWYGNKRVQQDAETGTSTGSNYPNMAMLNIGLGLGF